MDATAETVGASPKRGIRSPKPVGPGKKVPLQGGKDGGPTDGVLKKGHTYGNPAALGLSQLSDIVARETADAETPPEAPAPPTTQVPPAQSIAFDSQDAGYMQGDTSSQPVLLGSQPDIPLPSMVPDALLQVQPHHLSEIERIAAEQQNAFLRNTMLQVRICA